jgi:DNA-directed RNA polymerase specialized sigma24 family protein
MCADVEKALGKLVKDQYWIINLCYGLGMDSAAVGVEMDISQDAVRMRKNRAMNNLLNILGGERPRKERDYTGQEHDVERTSDEQFIDSE